MLRSKNRKFPTAPTNQVACRMASARPVSCVGWPREGGYASCHTRSSAISVCHLVLSSTSVWTCCSRSLAAIVIDRRTVLPRRDRCAIPRRCGVGRTLGVSRWMRHPSFRGPASTTSYPNWSSSLVTTAFASSSSPAITSARRFFRDEVREGLRSTGIADHDIVPVSYRKPRDLAADVPGTDETDCWHDSLHLLTPKSSEARLSGHARIWNRGAPIGGVRNLRNLLGGEVSFASEWLRDGATPCCGRRPQLLRGASLAPLRAG